LAEQRWRAHQLASLLARSDRLVAQIAARDERIDDLLAQVKALNARIARLEARLGGPPKTPHNSSLPPPRRRKASACARLRCAVSPAPAHDDDGHLWPRRWL
jgi:ABC-type transporter Mla subunit MlaD